MGILKNGIHGGFSGKVGSTVGSSWKNINYIKSTPKKRSKPFTTLQINQQAKFSMAINFLKPITFILQHSMASHKKNVSGHNIALQSLLKTAIKGSFPELEIDYPNVKLANGNLYASEGCVTSSSTCKIELTWDNSTGNYIAFEDDDITVLVHCPVSNSFKCFAKNVKRIDGLCELNLFASYSGKKVHVYFFFTSRDGKRYSESTYAGEAIVK